ncbi:MAG TPA: formyltransferase family protein [Gemmatimonadales bacterium]|nr:formyltransferase family protein [Gemmatimonadales bacterium]
MTSGGGLRVLLFTSNRMGIEVAAAVAELEEVRLLHVVTTALPRPATVLERARKTYRYFGPAGVLAAVRSHLPRPLAPAPAHRLDDELTRRLPSAIHLHYPDLHAPECLAHLRSLRPDLGIVFACYRLRKSLYSIPRLGTLNLHLGKAPEFRGSSPGFYELLAGVPEVGVTVHRVDDGLDSGPILLQRTLPLDAVPTGDPLQYLASLQREVLVPAGAALMAEAVRLEARGAAVEMPQPPSGFRPRRRATWAQQRELRRVVSDRRRASG